ncbi:hypothetical protein PVAG01_07453 [Phlyctema vagabunda]|uniref:Uncharacterized protein n=1 Tax=Phlyctema vagabunda TaxID=108571 RepID=A0ABR4PCG6_9HELO
MASSSSFCPPGVDAIFGPQVNPACRTFDFTRLFEESFFSIAPSAIFLLLATLRTTRIFFQRPIVNKGWLHVSKLVAIGLLAAVDITQLVLGSNSRSLKTPATIPSNVLAMLVTLFMLVLSHLEHCKAFRPSSIICTYISISLLLDIPQARTLWMSQSQQRWHATAITFQIAMAIKVLILLLESRGKTQLLLQDDHPRSPEETTNVFSRRVFWWLNKLFRKGYQKSLSLPDLFVLDSNLSSQKLGNDLQSKWDQNRKSTSKHTLARCICESFLGSLLAPLVPRILLTAFTYTQPFLVQAVTTFLAKDSESAPDNNGYGLIAAYGLVYSGIAISNGWYWHKQYRFITTIRGSLVSVIYSKTLRMGVGAATSSEATTLMSADVERIATGLRSLHETWAGGVELGLGLWLLYRQVGLAMLCMLGVTLACTFGASKTAQYATRRQKLWMEAMQKRLADTINAIGSLKSIKMLGLEDRLFTLVQDLRQKEVDACVHFRVATTAIITLAHASLFMNSVLVFAAFLPIANRDNLLFTTARIFNTLTLVSLISEPLQSFLQALPQLGMSLGCIQRIQAYLLTADHHDPRRHFDDDFDSLTSSREGKEPTEKIKQENAFVVRNGHFGWIAGSDAVLKDVNVEIPQGKLTLVVGPVGCGKTTLLHALLGEVVQVKGDVSCQRNEIAFCAQQPWLTNGTAREGIIGYSLDDPAWYDRVVRACALDLDFLELPLGDQTSVGSGGTALSGGQKQRLALARAVYARKSVVLLDDVLSGLDRHTERSVFDGLFGVDGLFRTSLPDTTVVLATHAVRHLKFADHVIAMHPGGNGVDQGTLSELNDRGHVLQNPEHAAQEEKEEQEELVRQAKQPKTDTKTNAPAGTHSKSAPVKVEETVSDRNILQFYLKAMGLWNTIGFMAMGVFTVGLWKVSEYWARLWAEHSEAHPENPQNSFYLGIYALLNGLALVIATFWFGHWLLKVIPKTGISFHERILGTVLNSTYPFLSRADTGGLATRFGQDLLLVDTELPTSFANTFFLLFILFAQLALIASASAYLLAAFPILAVLIYMIQRVYLRTSKRIRHLDLETKAPLYAQFTDALKGTASIRAFGWQSSSKLENETLLNDSQRPFYLLYCVQRWLECVLDFMVAGIAVVIVGVAVATRSKVGGAQIGVALLNLVSLGDTMKSLVKYWTQMETSIAAVSRIRNFIDVTPQELQPPAGAVIEKPRRSSDGTSIVLKDLSASYSQDGPKVLSELSLTIAAGEKIAICGRSGSGKSSFLNVLLGMIDVPSGELLIGGRSFETFGNKRLRQSVNTIPQDPYFFPGTFRENLDQESGFSDEEIQVRLRKVGLDSEVVKAGGLDAQLEREKFSAGQLQLFSLARAMLHPKGILLLDEATSNVDHETDKKMHDIIFNDFADQTVIAILHRREELHRFDRVALIEKGKVVSIGEPATVNLDA